MAQTKLQVITLTLHDLAKKRKIVIEDIKQEAFLPFSGGYWNHTVDFKIRLLTGEKTSQELQQVMMNLIPIAPSTTDDFHTWNDGSLHGGTLYFDEQIGTATHTVTLSDKTLFDTEGFIDGICTTKTKLMRRTWVHIIPKSV